MHNRKAARPRRPPAPHPRRISRVVRRGAVVDASDFGGVGENLRGLDHHREDGEHEDISVLFVLSVVINFR